MSPWVIHIEFYLISIDNHPFPEKMEVSSKSKEVESIKGFLSRVELATLFTKKKKYDELRKLVDGWLQQVYNMTHGIYEKMSKEERETMILPQ